MKSGRHRKGTQAEREAVVTAHHVMREGGREGREGRAWSHRGGKEIDSRKTSWENCHCL